MYEYLVEGEEDEDFEKEYRSASTQVDKITLKMFAATVDAGKLEKALDLVERLNNEKSFDIAMKTADNHRKLVDLIENAKYSKFGDPVYDDTFTTEMNHPSSISPESGQGRRPNKRPFNAV
mmetsp:Transcript_23729/g.65943  ORF Transcript_23729/g.65943 Transcript_23729/m.65943 type:complete len:121 (+) Transcript_23729:2-364(+)